jgi:putative ABC transport system substrate-binding protein
VSTVKLEELPSLAQRLIARRPDVIVASPIQYVRTLKEATKTIPIVMIATTDPVENGLVANLPRPEANITGVALSTPELTGKRIEFLKELLPDAAHLAIIHPSVGGNYAQRLQDSVTLAANRFGVSWQAFPAATREDIDKTLAHLGEKKFNAVYVHPNPLFYPMQKQIVELAQRHQIATLGEVPLFARNGFLLTYGAEPISLWAKGAEYVDKILRGSGPGDLPVEQPTRYNLVINLNTARTLGITVPQALLARADEVLE